VELDFNNKAMRKAMVADMKYWLTDLNIDGFRCDVAGEVPTDFWEATRVELNKVKPIFFLAEAEKPELLKNAFDMQYGWEAHYLFNQIAKGEKTVKDFDAYMTKIDTVFQKDDIYMNFTSNHDENSWNGTEYERMGDAVETFAALSYTMPGMPLIYNGQEYDLKKRLRFFEKDTIPHTAGKMGAVYEKLGALKTNNVALHGGKVKASYMRLATSNDSNILAFVREKDGKKVIYVANLSKKPITFTLPVEGNFADYMSGEKVILAKDQSHSFKPWEYKILVQ
jgi:glycosidase